MNIISEIQAMNKKLDFMLQQQGENTVSLIDFTSLKNEFERALGIIDASKTAIGNLKSTVVTNEQTIAAHVDTITKQAETIATNEATIAQHVATISLLSEASAELTNFANQVREKFTEFEEFLHLVKAPVAPAVAPVAPAVAPAVAPVAPAATVTPPVATVTPPTATVTEAPVVPVLAANADTVTPSNLDALYANAVAAPVSIAPLS